MLQSTGSFCIADADETASTISSMGTAASKCVLESPLSEKIGVVTHEVSPVSQSTTVPQSPQSQRREIVKHVVSLGSQCVTADFFKKLKLRVYALPFDWIRSCAAMVVHCILDGFADFLKADNYMDMDLGSSFDSGRERRQIGHKVFSEMLGGKGVMFPHRDPMHIEEDYAYTQRSVKRFQVLLKSSERKLFAVMKFSNQPWNEAQVWEWFQVFQALQTQTNIFELVVVMCVPNCGPRSDDEPFLYRQYSGSLSSDSRMLMYQVNCVGQVKGLNFHESPEYGKVKHLFMGSYEYDLAEDPLKSETAFPGCDVLWPVQPSWQRLKATSLELKAAFKEGKNSRVKVADILRNSGFAVEFALRKDGCWWVEAAFDVDTTRAADLAKQFLGSVVQASMSMHGNHVIQEMIGTLPLTKIPFVISELRYDMWYDTKIIACDEYGCRVIIKLLHSDTKNPALMELLDWLLHDTLELAKHEFAHYVVEEALEHYCQRRKVLDILSSEWLILMQDKSGAHVLLKVLEFGEKTDVISLASCHRKLGRNEIAKVKASNAGRMLTRALEEHPWYK